MKSAHTDSKRILILEDDPDIKELLVDWLTSVGYRVLAYTSVTDIIKLIEENQPDLVMLDYLVGDINGGEFCAQIKRHPTARHLPVMMLSAHQRVIDSLGHYGWDAFVAKPFDLDELQQQIEKLLTLKC